MGGGPRVGNRNPEKKAGWKIIFFPARSWEFVCFLGMPLPMKLCVAFAGALLERILYRFVFLRLFGFFSLLLGFMFGG